VVKFSQNMPEIPLFFNLFQKVTGSVVKVFAESVIFKKAFPKAGSPFKYP